MYRLPEYADELDIAIALARNLTAYISTRNRPSIPPLGFSCEQGSNQSPRDALNIFIRETLANKSNSIGIGFRFHDQGRWSEPPETLEEVRTPPPNIGEWSKIETTFYDHTGAVCETSGIEFRPAKRTDRQGNTYTVHAPGLSRRITACAARDQ